MKVIKFLFGKVMLPASFFFTLYSIFAYSINSTTEAGKDLLVRFLLVLAYCVIIAFANNIFRTELSTLIKVVIHYLAFLLPLVFIVVFTDKNNLIFPVFILITVLYALISIPVLITRAVLHHKNNDDQRYDSQFK